MNKKRIVSLICAISLLISVFSVTTAFATDPTADAARLTIGFVSEDGATVNPSLKANDKFWVTISLADYENLVGEANIVRDPDTGEILTEASIYDRVIALMTAFIDFDNTYVTPVLNLDTESYTWTSPYSKMNLNGVMMTNLYAPNELRFTIDTDKKAGLSFNITNSLLDANNGELLRFLFKVKSTVPTDASVEFSINPGTASGLTSLAMLNKPLANTPMPQPVDIKLTGFDAKFDATIGAGTSTSDPDQDAADTVISQISALNTVVALGDEAAIVAARGAFNGLTTTQQALVTNLTKLTSAEAALNTLKTNKAAADTVISQISALNTVVTLSDEAAIVAARGAFNGLTTTQQALVTNLTKLTSAEAALNLIKNPPIAQDKTELGIAIQQAQAILADGKTYTDRSLAFLNEKLTLAQRKYDSDKSLQISVDVALAGLNSAINSMVDITEYNQVKATAENIIANIGNYTADSAAYLQRKYDLAIAMVDGTPNTKQARVDSAVTILNGAIEQMIDQSAYNTVRAQAQSLLANSVTYTSGTASYLQRKYDLAFAMVDGTHSPKADRIASAIAILNNGMGALKTK